MSSRFIAVGELGYSDRMGPMLRDFVEQQLISDLNEYSLKGKVFDRDSILFDWSESCIEGHTTSYLDGEMENFSGIRMFDLANDFIAEGWMEFIPTEDVPIVFWGFLHSGAKYQIKEKETTEIPEHIWNGLDGDLKLAWKQYSPRKRKLP